MLRLESGKFPLYVLHSQLCNRYFLPRRSRLSEDIRLLINLPASAYG